MKTPHNPEFKDVLQSMLDNVSTEPAEPQPTDTQVKIIKLTRVGASDRQIENYLGLGRGIIKAWHSRKPAFKLAHKQAQIAYERDLKARMDQALA